MDGGGPQLTRRTFVALAGAGLTLGRAAAQPGGLAQPFVRIDPDGTVTVVTKHLEMGQGIASGLASVLADALDCDWARVRTEAAPVDPAVYKNLAFGFQATGGSTSLSNSWPQLRAAGATARAMLLAAAAARWQQPVDTLRTERGWVLDGTHRVSYGELADEAGRLPVPADVALRPPGPLVGGAQPRLDTPAVVRGAQVYGIDVRRPGQRVAVILRPPLFGARLATLDDTAAKALPGVRGVHRVPQGVAVVADSTWAALRGREALVVTWDESAAERRSSAQMLADFRRAAESGEPGADVLQRGDAAAALAGAAQVIEAEFEQPFLAHQPMEPLAVVLQMVDGVCEIWAGSQNPQADQAAAMRILGLPAERVRLHGLPAGGSFGRRATFAADWVSAACEVLRAHAEPVPLQLLWMREDMVQGGFFRPLNLHRVRIGLGADGRISGCEQTIVAPSFLPLRPGAPLRNDPTATDGHLAARYDVPAARVRWVNPACGVPVQMYRALALNHTTFVKEVLMDELARAAGTDALAFRLAHLAGHPRQAEVLRRVAALAGWGGPLPRGHALGLAVTEAFGSFVAHAARVRLDGDRIVVEQLACVVDCGTVVNPRTVQAQMEGGAAFGLTLALKNGITLDQGRVMQSNFHDAPVLRLAEMPRVVVEIVASTAPPTGVGEPGSVPVAAAVANAWARLTGRAVRSLPLPG